MLRSFLFLPLVAALSLLGGTQLRADGDFHLESMQDVAYSKSSSFSAGLSIGLPTGFMPQPPLDLAAAASGQIAPKSTTVLPASFGLGRDKSHSVWTNQISEVRSGGLLDITVGGHTSLVGSTLWSASDELHLKTVSLSVEDLHDFDKGNGFNFSVGGLDGLISPKAGSDGYTSPFAGMLSASAHERDKRGITYSVIGNGTIEIGGDTGHPIIATLKRDLVDRQIVTVDDKRGFSFDVPLINFNVLAGQAKDIGNFLKSVTAAIPEHVKARGPEAELTFRFLIANGVSVQNAERMAKTSLFTEIVTYQTQLAAIAEQNNGIIPREYRMLLAQGHVLLLGEASSYPGGSVVVPCPTTGVCEVPLNELAEKIKGDKDYFENLLKGFIIMNESNNGNIEVILNGLDKNFFYHSKAQEAIAIFELLMECAITDPDSFARFVGAAPWPDRPEGMDDFINAMAPIFGHDPEKLKAYGAEWLAFKASYEGEIPYNPYSGHLDIHMDSQNLGMFMLNSLNEYFPNLPDIGHFDPRSPHGIDYNVIWPLDFLGQGAFKSGALIAKGAAATIRAGSAAAYARAIVYLEQVALRRATNPSNYITGVDEAVFWSGLGGDGQIIAAQIAANEGRYTLETLRQFRNLKLPDYDRLNPEIVKAWEDASRAYAEGARGTVRVVLGNNVRPNSVWNRIEFPALRNNPHVAQIIRIDPTTGAETIIFGK